MTNVVKAIEGSFSLVEQVDSDDKKISKIICELCPVKCKLQNGQVGKCRVRKNILDEICLINYGNVVSACFDTIRKRPIYLIENNIESLTIGLTGCNNTCPFCQNYVVSQNEKFSNSYFLSPNDVIESALKNKVDYISFTYTEPIVWIEYFNDVKNEAKKNNIKVCLKTAGYISKEFSDILLENVDVMNLDIKPLDEKYLLSCGIKDNLHVYDLLEKALSRKIHTEISHLIIEEVNGNEEKIKQFSREMSCIDKTKNIGIHLLRHYPAWKSNYKVTSDEALETAKKILVDDGYKNIFIGDV